MAKVSVADDVLTALEDPWHDPDSGALVGWQSDPGFLVAAATGDHRSLLPGVWAASERFYCIGENGLELDADELDLTSIYTPNFVYDPRVRPDGVALFADAKGFTSQAMGEAMVRVLAEELATLEVEAHIGAIGPRNLEDGWWETGDPAPAPRADRPDAPHLCFVCGLDLPAMGEDLPWGASGNDPTFSYCPCCGTRFGNQDATLAGARTRRKRWEAEGHPWSEEGRKPQGWTVEPQLSNLPDRAR